ncbi:hypothetical protein [Actinophytocola sp.]|uniref:hypothetical protein n=1 Tax=Actinophytocola sp. TaxID=1872138 RepID=UPI00389A22F8
MRNVLPLTSASIDAEVNVERLPRTTEGRINLYNSTRRHSAIGMLSPDNFVQSLRAAASTLVSLELDADEADLVRLEEIGFEVFASIDALKGRVDRRNAEASGDLP